jgi:hypothetical protein
MGYPEMERPEFDLAPLLKLNPKVTILVNRTVDYENTQQRVSFFKRVRSKLDSAERDGNTVILFNHEGECGYLLDDEEFTFYTFFAREKPVRSPLEFMEKT